MYIGELVVDVCLYGWVVFDYVVEGVVFVVQQCGCVCCFGYIGCQWFDVVWIGFEQDVIGNYGIGVFVLVIGGVFEQVFVGGQQIVDLVVFLGYIGVDYIFYVFQCCIGFVVVFGVGVGYQYQCVVVVFFCCCYVLFQCFDFYLVVG